MHEPFTVNKNHPKGLFIYIPSAWLYNKKIDLPVEETTSNEITKANDVEGNYEGQQAIKSTCETKNVIIVHENHRSSAETSAPESVINNKLSANSEADLAIEMLDTVLEAEDEDSLETEIDSRRNSSRSVKSSDTNVSVIIPLRVVPMNETRNLVITDPEHIRNEIGAEIDDILERAVAQIELNEANQIQSDDDENVFKNRKFLTRLSDLISTKSNQQATPDVLSKTLERRKETVPRLKHSESAPDLKLFEGAENGFNDDTSVAYTLSDDDEAEEAKVPPQAPVFKAELFEKVATLRKKEKKMDEEEEHENPIKDEDTKSLDEEPVNKEDFRDKLEKLLSVPPSRLSLIAPTPLPRSSLINKSAKDEQQPLPRDTSTPAPVTATMLKQRELFDEVLKKLKRNDDVEYS